MKNIPKKIYLQIGEYVSQNDDTDFKDLEVSWCSDRIYKSDIVYYLKQKPKKVKHEKPI